MRRYRFGLVPVLLAVVYLAGCDEAQELAEKAKEEIDKEVESLEDEKTDSERKTRPVSPSTTKTTPTTNPTKTDDPGTKPVKPVTPGVRTLALEAFLSTPPHRRTDIGLEQLAAHETDKLEVTTMELNGSQVTAKGLETLQEFPNLKELNLAYLRLTLDGLKHVVKLTQLESLSLANTRINDEGLSLLPPLENLKTLNLDSCMQLTDLGFQHIAKLPALDTLSVDSTQIVGSGFRYFIEEKTPLKHLDVDLTRFGDKGFGHLRGSMLESLTAIEVNATDASVRGLAGCASLTSLIIDRNPLTDDGMRIIAGLKTLNHLSIKANSGVTDAGVARLRGLTKLQTLHMRDTQATKKQADVLMKANGNLKVVDYDELK